MVPLIGLTQKFQLKKKAIVKIKLDTQKCHSPSPLSSLFLYPSTHRFSKF